jgi:diguanylate cyclase (GGDEF)-like protein
LGAPVGFLLLRELTGAATSLREEFAANRLFYLYLWIGNLVALTAFGALLGAMADRLVATNGKLQALAVTDALTLLRNARFFSEVLPLESARADRQNQSLGLIIIDLDNFKRINDRFGHVAGDRALVHFASVLLRSIRRVDIPCRIGGEEFAVICPGAGLEDSARVAERILATLKESPLPHTSPPERLTASAGVSVRAPGQDHEELLLAADAALYEAKRAGKDRIATSRLSAEGEPAVTGTHGP